MLDDSMERERTLDDIIGAYYDRCISGPPPDPLDWIRSHRDFAADLADFFFQQNRLHLLAAPSTRRGRGGFSQ